MTIQPSVLSALLLACMSFCVVPAADAALEQTTGSPSAVFVDNLLSHMSLEEKVAQMIQADIASITPDELREYKLGSVLAGGNAAPEGNVRATPAAWLKLTDTFFRASLDARVEGHPAIPILFGIDAVHGNAKVRGATIFPHNVGLGAAHDPELIERIGTATAQEVAAIGVDWSFAPTLAVVRDVRWGRSYESYSESPDLVALYAPAMVTGLQGALGTNAYLSPGHTLSSVKHFVGDGGTFDGRDQGDTRLSEATLWRVHAAGYPAALRAGAQIVMASYNSWNGAKLHGNEHLLTGVLKGRMGFNGFVVGDWNAHEQLPGCTKERCAAAILAGVDMLMAPDSWKALYENTLTQVRSGEIPRARIDDAVNRILRVKTLARLFDKKSPAERSDAGDFSVLGNAAHRALAREAVRKSLVLLKNARHTLPLDAHAKILVAGAAADSIAIQSGGWTIDWQGDKNTNADFPGATSIYAGIQHAVAAAGGSVSYAASGNYTQKPDVAIVVFGEDPYAEFEGDRESLEYSPHRKHDLALLKRLRAAGIPTVVVFLSGRPLWVNPELNAADAFVAAWLPGSEGEGVADLLFATPDSHNDFTGRLPFSWPATAMPISFHVHDHVTGALFPLGAGLSLGQASEVTRLPEASRTAARSREIEGSLYRAGHPTAPWSLFVANADAQVHVTTTQQDSPDGAVRVLSKGGDSPLLLQWRGGTGSVVLSGRAVDLRHDAEQGRAIRMRYRVQAYPSQVTQMGLQCTAPCGKSNAMIDITATLRRAPLRTWQSLDIPLACYAARGADLSQIEMPFALATAGRLGLEIAEVSLGPSTHAQPCPTE